MHSYTITVTPNDDSGNSTTLTVDTSSGQARITSVHLQAPDGLTGRQMPSVDVDLLLRAVASPTDTPTAITATSTPAAPEPAPSVRDIRPVDGCVDEPPTTATTATSQHASHDTTRAAPEAAPVKRANPRRAAAARSAEGPATEDKSAPSSRARRSRNQPTPKKAAPQKAARKQTTAATAGTGAGTERVYRRMPDDFADVYRRVSTAAAVADHYGVPRYTAHSWIRRLKKQGAAAER